MKKIILFGTSIFAAKIFETIIDKYEIVALFTQPDKESGRKKEIIFSPCKELAIRKNIKIYQPNNLKEVIDEIKNLCPDLILTCAYGKILPKEILSIPTYCSYNIHASLLPKYPGASPIQYALLKGDKKTGITIIKMNEKIDQGKILVKKVVKINQDDNYTSLSEKLINTSIELVDKYLPTIFDNKIKLINQSKRKTLYSNMIKREDEKINLNNKTNVIINQIRALDGYSSAFLFFDNENVVKIFKANKGPKIEGKIGTIKISDNKTLLIKTKDGSIEVTQLQPSGKKIMKSSDFINGQKEITLKVFS